MDIEEIIRWLKDLDEGSRVYVDDDGLSIMEVNSDGEETGVHLELGSRGVDGDFR